MFRWTPPNEDREVINIHPEAKKALISLLQQHPEFKSSGIGYSEFIMLSVWKAWRDGWEAINPNNPEP